MDNLTIEKLDFFTNLFNLEDFNKKSAYELLNLSNTFRKYESDYSIKKKKELQFIKIAVIGSTTTSQLISLIKLFLYKQNIRNEIYEATYNSINSEIFDDSSELYKFSPDILLILTNHNDLKDYPPLFSNKSKIEEWVNEKSDYYESLWNKVSKISQCQIYHTNFVSPLTRQLGNMESNYFFSKTNCINSLNLELINRKPNNVVLLDLDYIASSIGKVKWFDDVSYLVSKQGFSIDATVEVAKLFSKLVASQIGKIRKCLVLDLDNTLWGGIVGDDGAEGINIDSNNPLGEAFQLFQHYIKSLKSRGVLLAVCSKNDIEIAKSPFQLNQNMILKLEDFSCFICNWDDKTVNLRKISQSLNIGLESLVFFDDNPAERAIVSEFLPEVSVIDVPDDPAYYVRSLNSSLEFEWLQISNEDLNRTESYIAESKRLDSVTSFVDYKSYLNSLDMSAIVSFSNKSDLPRFSQLLNKTNQFNLRTQRYSEGFLLDLSLNHDYVLFSIRLKDKFTDYGIISSIILKRIDDYLFIDSWVMSCRVFKRGVEYLAFQQIIEIANSMNIDKIIGEFIPTTKNSLVSNLYTELGFELFQNVQFNNTEEDSLYYVLDKKNAKLHEFFINYTRK